MEVDNHPSAQPTGASSATGAQMALTPFNHSPVTARGREIVARTRSETLYLVASSPALTRTPSLSRVRTFMQGRTRPASSPSSSLTPPGATKAAPTPLLSSDSREVEVEVEPASSTVLAQSLSAPLFRQGMQPVGLSPPPPPSGPGLRDPSMTSPTHGPQPRGRGEARGDEDMVDTEPRAPAVAASPRAPEAAHRVLASIVDTVRGTHAAVAVTGSPTVDVQRTSEVARETVPPPQAEGPAGLGRGLDPLGSANAPSSTPSTPTTGGSSRPGSVRGASSPLTPASPASSPASSITPALPTSSPRSSSTPPVPTLQHPPPTVPPPVVQPTMRRSGGTRLRRMGRDQLMRTPCREPCDARRRRT
jgi:hypothetical protein